MATATYITKYPHRSSKDTSMHAGLALRKASGIANGIRRVWRAVGNFMRAVDRRLTENLDLRARYYLNGNADRSDAKRHEK
jgi:hypothetical protein